MGLGASLLLSCSVWASQRESMPADDPGMGTRVVDPTGGLGQEAMGHQEVNQVRN
jgi:hypothetical protein